MSYADVVSQMQQIQSILAGMQTGTTSSSSSATSATDFASALDSASTGTSGTTATGSTNATSTATAGSLVTAAGVTGDDVVADAKKYLGVPYVFGGESTSGMDCSGLVQKAFSDLGVSVPRLVHEQQTVGTQVDSLKDAKPGDLIVLDGGNHIAIYAGNDTVIHAPYAGRTVSAQKIWFTDKDIVTIRRIVPAGDGSTTGVTAGTATSGSASGTLTSASAGTVGATTAASGTGLGTGSGTDTLNAATVARAAALMAMYAGSGTSDSDADSSSSLSSLLGSTGSSSSSVSSLLGTTGTSTSTAGLAALLGDGTTTSGSSTTTAQQLLAARIAAMGASV